MKSNTILYERLSAMQKSIRRGLTDDAGYWFFALANEGYFPIAVSRLKITAYEDIGSGDITSAMFALRCIDDAMDWYKSGKNAWRLAIANAVIVLSNADKSRAADHFQAVCRGRYLKNPRRQVPDWALDKHTLRGRKMGRGFDHFKKEGAKLIPANNDKWEEEAYQYWKSGILDSLKIKQPNLF